jgi:glycosyltransferase involved in cell wall biosynthesis
MRIVFIPGSCIPFTGKTLSSRPLGGIETAVIRLAEALDRLGHTVYVVSHAKDIPLTKPLYIPPHALGDLGAVDVLVAVRELMPLFLGVPARMKFFWTGDSYDQLQHLGLGDKRVRSTLTGLWAVSEWQADRLCEVSGYPRERSLIVRNGYAAELFSGDEHRARKRLIYSSTPYRGLAILAALFPRILAEHPDAELHVFSGMKVYEGSGSDAARIAEQFRGVFQRLATTPGVTVHGNILQAQLAREFMRSSILAYPNTFEETSCITALEAMAAGCVPVTSARGALPETIGDAGILLDGDPTSAAYGDTFVTCVSELLRDDDLWLRYHRRALERSRGTSWDAVAAEITTWSADYLVRL